MNHKKNTVVLLVLSSLLGWLCYPSQAAQAPLSRTLPKRFHQSQLNRTLLVTARRGNFLRVKGLLDRGADADAGGLTNTDKRGPLLLASTRHRTDIVRLLIAHGANVNARDAYGDTPLIFLSTAGKVAEVRLLVAHGADVNVLSNGGASALMFACGEGHTDVVRVLLVHQAKVDYEDAFDSDFGGGYTALMYAAVHGYADIVRLLIASHANVSLRSVEGISGNGCVVPSMTALTIAEQHHHASTVALLRVAGATD